MIHSLSNLQFCIVCKQWVKSPCFPGPPSNHKEAKTNTKSINHETQTIGE
jgi:hypothetical protein